MRIACSSFLASAAVLSIVVSVATPAMGAGYWRWYTGIGLVATGGPGNSVTPSVESTAVALTPDGSVLLDLMLPTREIVDSVIVCGHFGSGTTLNTHMLEAIGGQSENATLYTNTRRHEGTQCVAVDIPDFIVQGAVALELSTFDPAASFAIRVIGVKIGEPASVVAGNENPAEEGPVDEPAEPEAASPPSLAETEITPAVEGITAIEYTLTRPTPIQLRVYDVNGRPVRLLASGKQDAGEHRVVWDGRADNGHLLAPGTYYYEPATPAGKHARRPVQLR